ncbi:MAPEG family protein [Agrobacterium fabrum]|uniref:MAPEG family protein n=1 Tax=Agrobacterium fabrum TaxID=1176649 RepID=UPI003BA1C499
MFWPMIAHAFLVFILYALLLHRRKNHTLTSREAVTQYRERGEEGLASYLVNRNIANQFELPVLFHAICLLLYITDADNVVTVVLAWLFVISRYAHSYVHVTSNRLRYRAPLFGIGFALLVCLWGWLAIWLALE